MDQTFRHTRTVNRFNVQNGKVAMDRHRTKCLRYHDETYNGTWNSTSVPRLQPTFYNTVHADASHTQLGVVILQANRPITFYSRKLSLAQTRYTTTECELLSIVETLKEFHNILLGQRRTVYTDHKNLTYANFNTERVMCWHLNLEEYGPELIYLKGETNIVADALSRLDIIPSKKNIAHDIHYLADCFGLDNDDFLKDTYPLSYQIIRHFQQLDKKLIQKYQQKAVNFHLKAFRGGGKTHNLICYCTRIK